jgi:hypothetical protein
MALSDFKPVSQPLELLSPKDNKPLGIIINVVGPDSKEVRDVERQLQKEGIARGKAGEEIELEEIESVLIKKFAASVIGWNKKFDADMGGPYSPQFVSQLFNDPDYRWVVDQVATFATRRQNFFR